MYGYQCNVVTATAVQCVITAAVRQPDSFIFSDIRPFDTRKQLFVFWFCANKITTSIG